MGIFKAITVVFITALLVQYTSFVFTCEVTPEELHALVEADSEKLHVIVEPDSAKPSVDSSSEISTNSGYVNKKQKFKLQYNIAKSCIDLIVIQRLAAWPGRDQIQHKGRYYCLPRVLNPICSLCPRCTFSILLWVTPHNFACQWSDSWTVKGYQKRLFFCTSFRTRPYPACSTVSSYPLIHY